MKKITKDGYDNAIKVLKSSSRAPGFFASGLKGGYEAIFARDSMIASLGASLIGKEFKKPFRSSLATLAANQSRHGQIPNAVGDYNKERKSKITYNSIDSTLWYIIGHFIYAQAYQDKSLLKKYESSLKNAYTWLTYQDPNEDSLPVQQPTMDWQDAFPHKYGRTILTQALYFVCLKFMKKNKDARRIQHLVNGDSEKYLSFFDKKQGYYLPWIWKTHGEGIREQALWFDTLGNLFAIVSGISSPKITKSILSYIEKQKINRPYPCKAIYPPIKPEDKDWQDYFDASEAREANHYLNGGIWPFLGGFYVAALVKNGEIKKAEIELETLAQANKLAKGDLKEWGFYEWLQGESGEITGGSNPYQSWSAGMYIFAYECVRQKKIPYF